MALLSRNEVCPRSSLSLTLAGAALDPHADLQNLKGLKAGAVIRLVEGSILFGLFCFECSCLSVMLCLPPETASFSSI